MPKIGEKRTKNPAITLSIFASNCLADCDTVQGNAIYTFESGWFVERFWIEKVKETGYTSDVQVEQYTAGTNVISSSVFASMNSVTGQINVVDPNTGQPIQVGGSYEAKTMRQLHEHFSTNKNAIKISGWVRGERMYGANGNLTANLITEEVYIGTFEDYCLALQKEVEAANQWNLRKPDIIINILHGKQLKYYRDLGTGIVTTGDGQVIKAYSRCWGKTWDIIHPLRENMVIFYEAPQGHVKIYHVDEDGTFRDLYQYYGWGKDIVRFTNLGNNLVSIIGASGDTGYYGVRDNGMFFDVPNPSLK